MGYSYEIHKKEILTDEGQKLFIKIRDRVWELIETAGAFRQQEAFRGISGSSWDMIACIDRLVELGEIVEIKRDCWTQFKIYSTSQVSNY